MSARFRESDDSRRRPAGSTESENTGARVFGEDYGNGRLHIAVLESVVENDEIDRRVYGPEFVNAFAPVLAYGHGHILAEFSIDLIRLVAYVLCCGFRRSKDESACAPVVSARQHRYVETVA